MKYIINITFLFFVLVANAQTRPFINSIDKLTAVPGEKLIITGSGFVPGSMQVNIGAGKATITKSSANSLEVTIPFTATYGTVSALDLTTGRSGKSAQFFTPKFEGGPYNPASAETQVDFPTDQQYTYDLCACDFDGDGLTDVAVANNTGTNVSIYKNTSTLNNPSFSRENIPNGFQTISAECGDLNGDGKPEVIFTANQGAFTSQVFIYRNISTIGNIRFSKTEFRLPQSSGQNRIPRRFSISDLDGDGKNDLIMGNEEDNALVIYKNTTTTVGGTISLDNPKELVVNGAEWVGVVETGDFNNDGLPDIATFSNTLNSSTIYLFQNTSSPGNIQFEQIESIGQAAARINMIVADLNNDHFPEIITSSSINGTLEVFTNQSSGSTISFGSSPLIISNVSSPWGVRAADISGDGLVDLVAASRSTALYVIENTTTTGGDLTFESNAISTTRDNRNIRLFDVDGDAKADMVFTNSSESTTNGNMTVVLNHNCLTPAIFPADLTFCRNSPFTLSATRALNATYTWEVASGTATLGTNGNQTIDVTVTSGNAVGIKVTIASGDGNCSDAVTQTFTMTGGSPPAAPSISVNQPSICAGTDITLSGPAGMDTYLWTLPDGTETTLSTNSLNITNSSSSDAGIYSLRTQQSGSCVSDSRSVTVTVNEPPSVTIRNNGADQFCETSSTVLEVPEYPGFSYEWQGPGVSNETGVTLTANLDGDYTVTLTTNDANRCENVSNPYSLAVVNLPKSTFDLTDVVCVGKETSFAATSTGDDGLTLAYSWSLGDGTNESSASVTHAYSSPGNYEVALTTSYTELTGCASTGTNNITIGAIPNISIETPDGTEKCPADSLRLEITDSRVVSYNWSTGSTENFTYAKTAVSEDQTSVSVDIVSDIGCEISDNITVNNFVNSRIFISPLDLSLNGEGEIELPEGVTTVRLEATNGSSYSWSPAEIFDDSTASQVTAYPKTPSTEIMVTGLDAINECETSDSLMVNLPSVIARKSFSPNADNLGFDCWEILNTSALNGCTVYIFDQRGASVFEGDSPFPNDCVWNGNVNNGSTPAPEGVYYFVMKCDDSTYDMSGSILLGR